MLGLRGAARNAASVLRNVRHQSTYQPPNRPNNPHRNVYKQFGRPFAKVFLMAVFTHQAIYYSWLKLESIESTHQKEDEVRALEEELRNLQGKKGTSSSTT